MIKINLIEEIIPESYTYHISVNDYGNSIHFMEKNGRAYARIYWYRDDMNTMYFDSLSVDPMYREMGIGSEILHMTEMIALTMNFSKMCLFVKESSIAMNMYKRRSYEYFKDHEDQKGYVWLMKELV